MDYLDKYSPDNRYGSRYNELGTPNIQNKEGTQRPVNIVNQSLGGGAASNIQYNDINIHIHLPETYNPEAIKETLKQIGEQLGTNNSGKQTNKKSKIKESFWRERSMFGDSGL